MVYVYARQPVLSEAFFFSQIPRGRSPLSNTLRRGTVTVGSDHVNPL